MAEYRFQLKRCGYRVPNGIGPRRRRPKNAGSLLLLCGSRYLRDNDILMAFRAKAESEGTGYQTLINQTLRNAAGATAVDEATLPRVLREELKAG